MRGFSKISVFLLLIIGAVTYYFYFAPINSIYNKDEIFSSDTNKEYLSNPAILAYAEFLKQVQNMETISDLQDYISPYYFDQFAREWGPDGKGVSTLKDIYNLSSIEISKLNRNKSNNIIFSFIAMSEAVRKMGHPVGGPAKSPIYKYDGLVKCRVRMTSRGEQWYLQKQRCDSLTQAEKKSRMTKSERDQYLDQQFREQNLGIKN